MEGEKIEITSNDSGASPELKERHVVSVPYVQQCYHWDCGLACVSMILQMFKEPCDDVYTKDLDFVQCGESVWTIDLAYILNRHKVHTSMYTVTLGVHESHHKKAFYKESIGEDAIRVNKMFDNALQNGLSVEKRSLSIDDLMEHLQRDNPVIALVDWTQMKCEWCDSKLKQCWSCITCHAGPYQGHYVVVCGYDRQKGLIYYKNPDARAHDMCCMQMSQFDKARTSDGTDEDILYIYNTTFRGGEGDIRFMDHQEQSWASSHRRGDSE
ncbi:protein GUCD1 [Aplysia californica]|uniref:Protein GUCD1 n=1 Tax=Aplysia californica TaxID=6500 RepID=A0ABM0JWX0_APLCA|nr:protein GUCD1 [Aplysia californica]